MRLTPDILDALFLELPQGVALCDGETRLLWANRSWRQAVSRHLGVAPHEVPLGAPLASLLPQAWSRLAPYAASALAGVPAEASNERLAAEGDVFYWNVAMAPASLADAEPGFLLFVTDVTERVIAQRMLENRMRDSFRKLSALYAVASTGVGVKDWRAMLHDALRSTLDAVQATAGAIQLLDSSGAWLILAAHHGLPAEMMAPMERRPIELGLSGWIMRHQRALTANLTQDDRVSPLLRRSELAMFAGVPMTVRGRVTGVLSVYRGKRRPFGDPDVDLLGAVADQIAVGIENARLRQTHDRLLISEERTRLARELHDVVTQSLHSLTLFSEAVQRLLAAGKIEEGRQYAGRISETSQQALREMRLLLHNLRPTALQEAGLVQALRSRLEAVEGRAGIAFQLIADPDVRLPDSVEAACYHLAQEALNNALKHAGANHVSVRLEIDGEQLTLTVADDGQGFDPERVSGGGMGLNSMRERVERLGGAFSIRSDAAAGTTVTVRLNLNQISDRESGLDLIPLVG